MKLLRIGGSSGEDLRKFYDLSHGWGGDWVKPISAMLELVVYLEDVVEFPPQWMGTSHENLYFLVEGDYRQWLVGIHPLGEIHDGPGKARFEIRHPAPAPWARTVGYAETVEQAWQMIKSRLPLNYPAQEKEQ